MLYADYEVAICCRHARGLGSPMGWVGIVFLIFPWVGLSQARTVTGQLADKPTRGQSSRGLDNSRTGQLAEIFDLKFGVYNSSKCYFTQITLFIRCQYSIALELGLGLCLMYK